MDLNIKRILELTTVLSPQDVFNRPLGVDEDCFSATKIVSLVEKGVMGEDLSHLLSCVTCVENTLQYAKAEHNIEYANIAQHLRGAQAGGMLSALFNHLGIRRHRREPAPAVLGLPNSIFCIEDAKTRQLSLMCNVLPAAEAKDWKGVIPESLYVDGAIIAKKGLIQEEIDLTNDGKIDCLRISFIDGRLARRVQDGIASDQRVVDAIQVHGRFRGEKNGEFIGQASVEFVSPSTAERFGLLGEN
jgi:hypothetical protein